MGDTAAMRDFYTMADDLDRRRAVEGYADTLSPQLQPLARASTIRVELESAVLDQSIRELTVD